MSWDAMRKKKKREGLIWNEIEQNSNKKKEKYFWVISIKTF